MLTRGHLIGQIVDDLAGIAGQAKQRARLHLFDIHTYVEDFAKELLNRVLGLNLVNLNAERSNNPGLDLGDAAKGWAFQITGDKTGTKVKGTLEKIDADQKAKYPNLRVLVIGERQKDYTFNGEPYEGFGFTPEMVWDFNDLCSRLMPLPIEKLIEVRDYVSQESRRVRIELEIPDETGQFQTNIDHLIEALPKPQLSDGGKMSSYFVERDDPLESGQVEAAITELSTRLARLPRLTREVFKFLFERRDDETAGMHNDFRMSDPKLRRIYRGDDLDGDLALLCEARLLGVHAPEEPGQAAYWQLYFPDRDRQFHTAFADYVAARGIDPRKPLVLLDFSDF